MCLDGYVVGEGAEHAVPCVVGTMIVNTSMKGIARGQDTDAKYTYACMSA